MKNMFKLIGFIALASVIGFSFTSCDTGGGSGNGGSGGGGNGDGGNSNGTPPPISSFAGTWTAVANTTFVTSPIYAIAYGNNKFVAVGSNGKMAYSSDGTTWTAVSNSTFGTGANDDIRAIAWGNNKFVAVGQWQNGVFIG